MITVYIAGPYRAKTARDREQNIQRAEDLALDVAGLGAAPLCPHTMTRFFDGTISDRFWLEATAELLRRADAAIFVPGWERSEGSRAERALAVGLGIGVFDSVEDLRGWVDAAPEDRERKKVEGLDLSTEVKADRREGVVSEIGAELARAQSIHGPMRSAHEGFAVLLEEVEELKTEVWKKTAARDPAKMREEAIQIGAMAARFVLDLLDVET